MNDGTSKPSIQSMSILTYALDVFTLELARLKTHFLVVVVACLSILICLKSIRKRNLPPGPWGLPILGYLPFLSSQEPQIQLEKFRKKYGDVFGMYLGNRFALFLGNIALSKEAYNLDEFSGRPDGAFPISKKSTHFAAINGQPWRVRRKLSSKALRNLGTGTQMIQNVSRINQALDQLESKLSSHPNGEVNVRSLLTHAATSVILNFVCGKTFSSNHKSYQTVERFLKFFAENGASLSMDIYLPWAKPFLNAVTPSRHEATKIFDDMEEFTRLEIESHQQNRPEEPKDLLDFYLQHYETQGGISIDDISGDAQVMIFAGADTVRGTTEWFLLCMALFPEIQEKIFREIDDVLGPSGEIRYEEKNKLPYTEASILESMRFKSLLPINPYHSALKDTKFQGYDIPEGSLVFALLWTIHNDPAHWSHPKEYRPEHFLSSDKTTVIVPEAFVPFSPGKRTCIGDKVALIGVFQFCISILQRFEILPPVDGLKMDGNLRINVEAMHPVVRMIKRCH